MAGRWPHPLLAAAVGHRGRQPAEAKAKRRAQWAQAEAEALLQVEAGALLQAEAEAAAEAEAVEAVRELEAQRTVWAWWRLLARRCSGCGGDE